MPRIHDISVESRGGKRGFLFTVNAVATNRHSARLRARVKVVSRFPAKMFRTRAVGITEKSDGVMKDYDVKIFVPEDDIRDDIGMQDIKDAFEDML